MTAVSRAAAVLLAGALVLTGGAASAAQKTKKDKADDVAPVADITRVTVKNTGKALTVKVKLAKASAGRTHVVATLTPVVAATPAPEGTDGTGTTEPAATATYVARTITKGNAKGKGKKVGATLETTAAGATEATAADCPGIKAAVSAGRNGQVLIRIPQSCFGDDAGDFTVDVATENADAEVLDELAGEVTVDQD